MILGIDASRSNRGVATGTERYSSEVIAALVAQAPMHQIRLYSHKQIAEKDAGIQYIFLPPKKLWTHLALGPELVRNPPDSLFVPAHVLPLNQSRRNTPRRIVTLHDVGYKYFPQAHGWRQRQYLEWSTHFTCKHAHVVIADSEATRADLIKFYQLPEDRCRVAHPGFTPLVPVTPEDVASARQVLSIHGLYVLSIGTLQPRKNLVRLLQAWQQVLAEWTEPPRPILVVAGSKGWGKQDLVGLAASLGITQHVRFTGYIDDARKSALLHGAAALAFPSLFEGFGFPVLEAQSAGVQVVCSNTSSLPEVAGESAVLVNPLQVEDIARGLMVALTQPSAERINTGRRNVMRFDWTNTARIVLAAMTQVS